MKTSVIFLACTFPFVLLSCSGNDDDSFPFAEVGKILVKKDSERWITVTAAAEISGNTITITGKNKNNEEINLLVNISNAIGSYQVEGTSGALPEASITLTDNRGTSYSSSFYDDGVVVGTLYIDEINEADKTISGLFTAKVKQSALAETEVIFSTGSFTKIQIK